MKFTGKRKNGFTLVETILATVILCGAVLAFGAVSTRALSYTRLNRQYETAMSLADRQLTLIDYVGLETFLSYDKKSGEFEGTEPVYTWQVSVKESYIRDLYDVGIRVNWIERQREYSVYVETRMNAGEQIMQRTGQ